MKLAALVWLLSGAVGASQASVATPPPELCLRLARAPEPVALQGVREQVSQMLAVLSDCQGSPEFLAALGHGFNRLGEPVEALGHLERAVMLDPAPPGARLDYAIALAQTGETAAAVTLVDQLLQQPDVPVLLLPELQRQRAVWVDGAWSRRSVVGLRVGRDTNLLGSPGLSNLTITLPGLAVQLPLEPSFQNQSGSTTTASFQTEWQRVALDGSYWELSGGLRYRESPTTALARTQQVDLAAERGWNFAGGTGSVGALPLAGRGEFNGAYLSAGSSRFTTGTNVTYRLMGGAAGWLHQSPGNCQQRVGVEFQQRRYGNSPVLDGNYTGLLGQWVCERPQGQQWQLGVRWGKDDSTQPDRPGGDQQQRSIRLGAYLPVRSWWPERMGTPGILNSGSVLVDADHSWLDDEIGFSPLLGNGAVRRIQRTQWRLEYQHPLSRQWQLQLGLEAIRQRSSLELFLLRNKGLYLSLRFGF